MRPTSVTSVACSGSLVAALMGCGSASGDRQACGEPLPASTATCASGTIEAGELCLFLEGHAPVSFLAPSLPLPRPVLLPGDFNGDGVTDLFVGGQIHPGRVAADGPAFDPPVAIAGSTYLVDVAVGDLDHDGLDDVVHAYRHVNPHDEPGAAEDRHELRFSWGDPALAQPSGATLELGGVYPFAVEVVDIDGDGLDELAVSHRADDVATCGVTVMTAPPNGREPLAELFTLGAIGDNRCGFTIGRIDGDARLDLALDAASEVHLGLADGEAAVRQPSTRRPASPSAAFGLELECGGPPAAVDHRPDGLRVWTADAAFDYAVIDELPATEVRGHAIGDLNHDGNHDLVVCAQSGVDVHLGVSGDGFTLAGSLAIDCAVVVIADLDGDGSDDLGVLATDDTVHVHRSAI